MEWQDNDKNKVNDYYNTLLELNPELKKLDSHKQYDVCYGAISKFNFDDIDFYSSIVFTIMLTYNTNIGSLKNGLVTKFKTEMNWVPSPKTLGKLQDIVFKID